MKRSCRLTIVSLLLGAVPAFAADKPGVSSALPAAQAPGSQAAPAPGPGTLSRVPATAPVAPGTAAASGVAAAVATPLKCTASVEYEAAKWGAGIKYRSYRVTHDRGARQPLPAGAKIKWSAPGGFSGYGGEYVLTAALPPGQTIEVGTSEHIPPNVDPKTVMKGTKATTLTCEAKLLP